MTMLRHIADTIISFCGIPTVNPTVPSAVSSLGVTPRPGAISFVWPVPTIRPIGTEYRLMEATVNSYGAASEAWRGDALGTTITKANTAGYYFWLDSLGSNGSYFTFPGVSSGMPGNALLTDTGDVAPNAATRILNAFTASVPHSASTFDQLRAVTQVASDSGIYELTFTGQLLCNSFTTAGDILLQFGVDSGSGAFSPSSPIAKYRVTALNQRVTANFAATFTTSGSGPWNIRAGYVDDGAGNTYSGSDLALRTTVVRR